jgi:hypothetical protein
VSNSKKNSPATGIRRQGETFNYIVELALNYMQPLLFLNGFQMLYSETINIVKWFQEQRLAM